jgi:hypothetical protein
MSMRWDNPEDPKTALFAMLYHGATSAAYAVSESAEGRRDPQVALAVAIQALSEGMADYDLALRLREREDRYGEEDADSDFETEEEDADEAEVEDEAEDAEDDEADEDDMAQLSLPFGTAPIEGVPPAHPVQAEIEALLPSFETVRSCVEAEGFVVTNRSISLAMPVWLGFNALSKYREDEHFAAIRDYIKTYIKPICFAAMGKEVK